MTAARSNSPGLRRLLWLANSKKEKGWLSFGRPSRTRKNGRVEVQFQPTGMRCRMRFTQDTHLTARSDRVQRDRAGGPEDPGRGPVDALFER